MLVNLAQLRAQRTSPSTFQSTTVEFEVDDPRRLKHLSLEQQKKRAKELLKAVQLHESDALEHWRSHGLNPDEAKLSNAQRVIARENGFRKWEELKAHADHIRIAQQAVRDGGPSVLDGGQRTLHIRCGTDIMHKLAVAGFEGDFLWFGDPYIFGPVPQTDSLDEFVRIRANCINVPFDELMTMYQELDQAHQYQRVMIWSEFDAFDQLILARLLAHFCEPAQRPPRLQFINVTRFPGVKIFNGIGQLPPEALRVLWNDFVDVSEAELQAGNTAWAGIVSAEPVALAEFVSRRKGVLPVMRRALKRHLQELPWTGNGLGLSEYTILRILDDKGPLTAARLFGWFQNHYDPLPGMGDSFFWKLVNGLAETDKPAIRLRRRGDKPNEWDLELSPFGTRLLNNEVDWLTTNPIKRWIDGVYIDSRAVSHWRWDENADTVVEV